MPIRVNVPNIGVVNFPDGMSESAITAEVTKMTAEPARSPDRPQGLATIGDMAGDAIGGLRASAMNTVVGGGDMLRRGWNAVMPESMEVDRIVDEPDVRALTTPPDSPAGRSAKVVGDIAQFFMPTGLAGAATKGVKLGAEIAKSGALTMAQTGSPTQAATSAALTGVIPGAGAVVKAGKGLQSKAEMLVRSAMKPTVASLRKISGAGGMDAKANALVRFVIDHKLTTPDRARTLFLETEQELMKLLATKNAATDAPTRAARYLQALERSAAKQGLGADDVAQINKAAAELLEGPMGKDVITMVSTAHPTLLGANGKPLMVLRPQSTRALRTDVMADEALDSARASSRWSTTKAWGEQKGASMEAQKAVERAQRDAVKEAVPGARELLQTEGKAIQAEQALDRMAQRTGNREAVSLPAQIVGGAELISGNVPVLAVASNWLRNNGMKAGIWADRIGKAIEQGNAPLVVEIFKRMGVALPAQMGTPTPTPATR